MRELDTVYRDGFRHTFVNGESVTYARPPFDVLFQVDLLDRPEGEEASGTFEILGEADKYTGKAVTFTVKLPVT